MANLNKWWGYLHENGSVQAKRFYSVGDLDEAAESPFVVHVVQPFYARDRDYALGVIIEKTMQWMKTQK
jgi:hypothetical protein